MSWSKKIVCSVLNFSNQREIHLDVTIELETDKKTVSSVGLSSFLNPIFLAKETASVPIISAINQALRDRRERCLAEAVVKLLKRVPRKG